jgi:hypothetical protein
VSLSLIFVAIIFVGCVATVLLTRVWYPLFTKIPPYDPQLFSNADCSLPCWQGLHVGETSTEEVEALFGAGVGQDRGRYTTYRCQSCIDYTIDAHVLDGHLLQLNFYDLDITLGELINQLGIPEYVDTRIMHNIDSVDRPPMWATMVIYYPQQGISFFANYVEVTENATHVCPHENTEIYSVRVTEPRSIDDYLAGDELTPEQIEARRNSLHAWQDFTCTPYPIP